MVKILGISGSPRKSGTEYMVQECLKAAEEIPGVTTEFITLRGKRIGFCLHCDRCIREDKLWCPANEKDDLKEIYPKFIEADGYILGSPVYQMNMSGQLLTFLNRMRPMWKLVKDGAFKTRVGGAIVVGGTRHGGQENALEAILNFYKTMGIIPVTGGPWGYNGGAVWSQDKKELGVREDEVGMATVRVMGRRVGEVTSLIAAGKSVYALTPNLKG
ncbi:MAG TPA: flavodoxin family protein [Bacillota bacterium]